MRFSTLTALALTTSALCNVSAAWANDDLRIVDEPLELTVHLHHYLYTNYEEDWPIEQKAREVTGIHLKNATVGSNSTNSEEAMNLLLATGKLPDIVGSHLIKDFVNQYGPQGAFVPLNDLIEEHAPNVKALFEANPKIKSAITAADGNIYYLPYTPDGKFGRGYFIRYDWLDKLGLEVPGTVDEFYEVLTAFRNQDPNGNGQKDEVPFFARQWEELIRLVTLWDGRSSGSDTYHDFYVDDGQIRHPYMGEGYREGIKNLAKWYSEGLIDAEVFTRGSSSREYLLSEDLGGSTHDWFASTAGYNDVLQEKVPGFDFRAFVPPASISGVQMEEHRRIPVKPDGWAISATNDHPVETIKYFDFWFGGKGREMVNFGVEGLTYDVIDGEPVFKEEFLSNGRPINSQLYEIGGQLAARGYYQDYRYEIQWTNEKALEGIALYEAGDYLIEDFLGVAFNEEEQKVYDKYYSAAQTYMLEKQQAWILGASDVEAEWDDYLAQLDRMGMGDVLEVMQSAYTRQYGG
ncbi:extracellular solute-binding protein [Tropicimonas sediminicola]|uniref:Carbohydrate ABC transporter substrate-binding protein, CUT1 family n=1 Tax=Tropicimonas sediminicola TaxID=1031541 RepID=A0A239F3A4_9RHOB|nr:extracellular solute-binding protein [Tropicimonas sediminicola]SNS51315.1 carbohydrate ABC transporter substrate-binding protein, CUT1 family [Tropicimonas sediminicola]